MISVDLVRMGLKKVEVCGIMDYNEQFVQLINRNLEVSYEYL